MDRWRALLTALLSLLHLGRSRRLAKLAAVLREDDRLELLVLPLSEHEDLPSCVVLHRLLVDLLDFGLGDLASLE